MNQDIEHLRLLSIFHYIVAGLTALCACFPLIHFTIGMLMLFAPEVFKGNHPNNPDELWFIGIIFIIFPGLFILSGWTLAFFILLAGRNLASRRRYTFCLVIAGIMCVIVPFGTVLGVFTIIVLVRPSVKELFERADGSHPLM